MRYLVTRANLVKQETLSTIAQHLELGDILQLGKNALGSGAFRLPSILADGLEALLGAVYVDSGFVSAQQAIGFLYAHHFENLEDYGHKDAKTRLQEHLQAKHSSLPRYTLVNIPVWRVLPKFLRCCAR